MALLLVALGVWAVAFSGQMPLQLMGAGIGGILLSGFLSQRYFYRHYRISKKDAWADVPEEIVRANPDAFFGTSSGSIFGVRSRLIA